MAVIGAFWSTGGEGFRLKMLSNFIAGKERAMSRYFTAALACFGDCALKMRYWRE
jgi:hypothetical protein